MSPLLSEVRIQNVLKSQKIGRLSCFFVDQPYIIPITYVIDEEFIYAQTNDGTKLEIIRLNPSVSFEVSLKQKGHPGESVVIAGEFEELHHEDAAYARQYFLANAFPFINKIQEGITLPAETQFPENIRRVKEVIYRIRVRSVEYYIEQPL